MVFSSFSITIKTILLSRIVHNNYNVSSRFVIMPSRTSSFFHLYFGTVGCYPKIVFGTDTVTSLFCFMTGRRRDD